MNYIAHLHLAHVSGTSLLGNFLGDFVKGRDFQHLPSELETGIKLHRKIDRYTDEHESILALRTLFPKHLRRMSGVVLDVYFDHLLVSRWQEYASLPLLQLLDDFYLQLEDYDGKLNQRFMNTRNGLLQYRWLIDYKQEQTCLRAYTAIEKRLKGKILFADEAHAFVINERVAIQQVFQEFYPQLIKSAQQIVVDLKR